MARGRDLAPGPAPTVTMETHICLPVLVIRVNTSPREGTRDVSASEQHLHVRNGALPWRSDHFEGGQNLGGLRVRGSLSFLSCPVDVPITIRGNVISLELL